jgi:type VI secretion system protein ImpB
MGSESHQHKLDRVRPPRVQITYDVETNGAMRKVELPFVVGVLADLSAQRKDPLPAFKERKFTDIDADNFNNVLEKASPRLAMKVDNKLTNDETKVAVELNFKHIDDFEPARVAAQVGPLNELLEMRRRLTELLGKLEGNDKLEKLLGDILNNTEAKEALAKRLGVEGEGSATPTEESK